MARRPKPICALNRPRPGGNGTARRLATGRERKKASAHIQPTRRQTSQVSTPQKRGKAMVLARRRVVA
jgi:hypothetical protein